MRHRSTVAIGDRFTRASATRQVYAVVALVERPGHPLHARLQAEGGTEGDTLLVSVAALADAEFYRRLPSLGLDGAA